MTPAGNTRVIRPRLGDRFDRQFVWQKDERHDDSSKEVP